MSYFKFPIDHHICVIKTLPIKSYLILLFILDPPLKRRVGYRGSVEHVGFQKCDIHSYIGAIGGRIIATVSFFMYGVP